MNLIKDPLIPMVGVVTDIRTDTPDVKTFRVVGLDGKKPFVHIPGQCAMLSMPGVGEALFSITSSPTNEEYLEFSIKKCGCVTTWLHQIEVGQQITLRGPYGNGFPVETELKGKDLLFIAGGIGLAPLRSVINYVGIFAPTTAQLILCMVPAARKIWWITLRSSTSGARKTVSTFISPLTGNSRTGTAMWGLFPLCQRTEF